VLAVDLLIQPNIFGLVEKVLTFAHMRWLPSLQTHYVAEYIACVLRHE